MTGTAGEEPRGSTEDDVLLREAEKIVTALGRMFPGLCEVVLHDLRRPDQAIRAIESNLSGRSVGDPATELGLARIEDPEFPGIVQNYANRFPDGRPAKSTSIGIKNAAGDYIAALCLNLDVSVLSPVTLALSNLVATDTEDTEGTVVAELPVPELSEPFLEATLARFRGELAQVPPQYSAL